MQVVPLAEGVDDVGVGVLRVEQGIVAGSCRKAYSPCTETLLVHRLGLGAHDAAELGLLHGAVAVVEDAGVGVPDLGVAGLEQVGSSSDQGVFGRIEAPVVAGLVAGHAHEGARGQHDLDVAADDVLLEGVAAQARGHAGRGSFGSSRPARQSSGRGRMIT